jgi:Trk K+ transport system NAD-binding subunit
VNANKLKHQYNAKFKIVARVLYEENFEVARMNGATDVISPTLMAANAIMDLL